MKKKISNFLIYNVIPFFIYCLMRLIWLTTKKHYHHLSDFTDRQYIFACWHSELLISPQYYRKLFSGHNAGAIASGHKDGQIVSNTIQYFNIYPIEGSSSKGGVKALINALNALKKGDDVLITPDGPRGPRFSVGDGIVALAQKSNLQVFTINYKANKYWQLKSWDKFIIPKPFSTIEIYTKLLDLNMLDNQEAKKIVNETMVQYTTI